MGINTIEYVLFFNLFYKVIILTLETLLGKVKELRTLIDKE